MAPIAPLKMLVAPAAKAIARLSDSLTYDDIPCVVDERTHQAPRNSRRYYFDAK